MAARLWMSGALGVIGLAALATGCTDDGVSLHAICPVPPDIEDNACIWDPSSEICVAEGVLNTLSATSYRLNLKVQSGLKSRMRDVPVLAEPNGIQITDAEVELRVFDGDIINFPEEPLPDGSKLPKLANPYRVAASGYADPQGLATAIITIMGKEYIDRLNGKVKQIVAVVTVHGITNGSEDVESGEFNWPIRLIQASPLSVNGECYSASFCLGSLGQDGFAQVCSDGFATD
jgi:hypothetical protein